MMSELMGADLLDELKQKEKDLILAAELGKSLLEEKQRLEQDLSALREDFRCLEEVTQIHFWCNRA